MILKRLVLSFLFLLGLPFFYGVQGAQIQEGSFIRDAEIEATLKEFIEPIFKAAGLDAKRLKLFLIASPEINAAASADFSIFVNTGLITKASCAEEVIGVLAHETGHIAGGHLIHRADSAKKSTMAAMAAMALGAAAIVAGSPDAGVGIIMGGQSMAQNTFMHHSRGQEAAADQAALKYLNATQIPAQGFYDFMKLLAKQEYLSADRQDVYVRSHPLSSDRLELMKTNLEKDKHKNYQVSAAVQTKFKRIRAKIDGFMLPSKAVLMKYPTRDTSPEARYARAIAHFRDRDTAKALDLTEQLISEYPQDPYYYDLKGQILFETGSPEKAYVAYQKALSLSPKSTLIRIAMVQAKLESQNKGVLDDAIDHLKKAQQEEPENPGIWQLLAVAYGHDGNVGKTALALAEKAFLVEDYEQAIQQGKRAMHILKDSPEKRRAVEIVEIALIEKKKNQKFYS